MRITALALPFVLVVTPALGADKPDPSAVAGRIDHHVGARLAAAGVRPAPVAADATFLRRTYLLLVGRIPLPSEVHAFLEDTDPAKRATLLDRPPATARLFLGVQLDCAQCHDHPFAKWSRDQFWGLAGFFAGIEHTQPNNFFGPLREVFDRRELVIPNTDRVVQATFLDDKEPDWKARTSSRVTLAEWVTAKNNAFFARATANRIWGYVFGTGVYEPVDDFTDEHRPSHPEMLDELARAFADSGFDLKF